MARPLPAFVAHCVELLEAAGPVRVRRMFGGFGLYVDDLFIAIIAFERLYLKADAASEARFEQAGGQRFEYTAEGRTVGLRYWTPPAEALDAPALMQPWARLAMQAALSARARPAAARAARPAARTPRR
jgi:DNA transformation protein